MKTRTLMLLALGCGVAIMLAGAVFLFQLTTQDDVEPPVPVGERASVGDMAVTVTSFEEANGRLRVSVTIGGTPDSDPVTAFRLIASARPVEPGASTCPPITEAVSVDAPESCSIDFDVSDADGVSRVLFYERGDERARWVIDAAR